MPLQEVSSVENFMTAWSGIFVSDCLSSDIASLEKEWVTPWKNESLVSEFLDQIEQLRELPTPIRYLAAQESYDRIGLVVDMHDEVVRIISAVINQNTMSRNKKTSGWIGCWLMYCALRDFDTRRSCCPTVRQEEKAYRRRLILISRALPSGMATEELLSTLKRHVTAYKRYSS